MASGTFEVSIESLEITDAGVDGRGVNLGGEWRLNFQAFDEPPPPNFRALYATFNQNRVFSGDEYTDLGSFTTDVNLFTRRGEETFQNLITLRTFGTEDDGRTGDDVLPGTRFGVQVTANEGFEDDVTIRTSREPYTGRGDYFEYEVTYHVEWTPHVPFVEEEDQEEFALEEDVFSEDQTIIGEEAIISLDATTSNTDLFFS